MLFNLLLLAADEGGDQPQNPMFLPMMLIGLFMIFYFMVIRPANRRQEAERRALLENLEKNDRVLTIGGIYGNVVAINDKEDEMTLNLGDNVKIKMTRSSVAKNYSAEERRKEAAEAANPAKT